MEQRILLGNEAIGRGLVESGCSVFTSYPGTPASEILPAVLRFADETASSMHIEWSVNEKAAFETALAASYTGKRAAVAMKQVGLNVAADPFTRSAYLGVVGGFLVVAADDPGPHSSQTEQDSRFFAHFAKVPVVDPASPREAKEMIGPAFALSEKYSVPVVVRPTTRICHARQDVPCGEPVRLGRPADFRKDPGRWIATPAFLPKLHRILNEKLDAIAADPDWTPRRISGDGSGGRPCVIASGVAFSHACEVLEDLGCLDRVDLFQVLLPHPLHRAFIEEVNGRYERILVLEETYPVIELQLRNGKALGRISGDVPREGELTPDIVEDVLRRFLDLAPVATKAAAAPGRRPTLCAGCPHRAAFYAIREAFPRGIFPSDIGCYTLGMNLGAIDTCHVMGACISQGAGFYHAYAQDGGPIPTIVVTIGDSTFFHAGIPALVNAVFQGAKFILVLLDNGTTAMTGGQATPQNGVRGDGSAGPVISIPGLIKACGVRFLQECDPYDMDAFRRILEEADRHARSPEGGVAVLVSKHPCILPSAVRKSQAAVPVFVTEDCTGCGHCIEDFECPALLFDEETERVRVDRDLCIGCGVCLKVCPAGAIVEA